MCLNHGSRVGELWKGGEKPLLRPFSQHRLLWKGLPSRAGQVEPEKGLGREFSDPSEPCGVLGRAMGPPGETPPCPSHLPRVFFPGPQFSLYLVDERLPLVPLFKWNHGLPSAPLLARLLPPPRPGCPRPLLLAGQAGELQLLQLAGEGPGAGGGGSGRGWAWAGPQPSVFPPGEGASTARLAGPPQSLPSRSDSLSAFPLLEPRRQKRLQERLKAPTIGALGRQSGTGEPHSRQAVGSLSFCLQVWPPPSRPLPPRRPCHSSNFQQRETSSTSTSTSRQTPGPTPLPPQPPGPPRPLPAAGGGWRPCWRCPRLPLCGPHPPSPTAACCAALSDSSLTGSCPRACVRPWPRGGSCGGGTWACPPLRSGPPPLSPAPGMSSASVWRQPGKAGWQPGGRDGRAPARGPGNSPSGPSAGLSCPAPSPHSAAAWISRMPPVPLPAQTGHLLRPGLSPQ